MCSSSFSLRAKFFLASFMLHFCDNGFAWFASNIFDLGADLIYVRS